MAGANSLSGIGLYVFPEGDEGGKVFIRKTAISWRVCMSTQGVETKSDMYKIVAEVVLEREDLAQQIAELLSR